MHIQVVDVGEVCHELRPFLAVKNSAFSYVSEQQGLLLILTPSQTRDTPPCCFSARGKSFRVQSLVTEISRFFSHILI